MTISNKPTYPQRPDNRAALPRIDYRIGGYPEIRDAIWSVLNAAPELAAWTHRVADDPGVALVEVAAVVGDILTFYQDHYANEAFLRTAAWQESIRELVRLTGYRLTPPTGGSTFFAFTMKGEKPIEIPASFPVKAELAGGDKPVNFLTGDPFTAIPELSAFHLYRARHDNSGLFAGETEFEIERINGSDAPDRKDALDLKAGDKLMLIPEEPSWLFTGTIDAPIGPQPVAPQIIKVKSVERILDRLIVESETPIANSRTGTIRAYRIGRTFSHFGHNAPNKYHRSKKTGSEVTGTYEYDTRFTRHWYHQCKQFTSSSSLHRRDIPLDQEVNDLLVGSMAIIEAPIEFGDETRRIVIARQIESLRARPLDIGDLSGSCTFVRLKTAIASNDSPESDLRTVRLHETTSPELQLNRKTTGATGDFSGTNQLFYYGRPAEVQRLNGRTVIFKADDGRYAMRQVVAVESSYPSYPRMRQITLDKMLLDFSPEDFQESSQTVTVYGNIVPATQGKLEAMAVLGNGDMRESFQSFKLPKSPLTHHQDPAATPPTQPELLIRVEGRQWQLVESFYGLGPKDEVYIVRHDNDGHAWVQFGDGIMGSRLPSGIKNVAAEYRTGTGALGLMKADAKPTAGAKLDKLDKIFLPGEVTGGSQGELAVNARRNAPPKLQTLGRLVSLADYESEARSIPGAVTAQAAWDISDGSPAIQVRLLLEQKQQSDIQFADAAKTIREADQARGINRYPIEVTQCELRYLCLTIEYAHDAALVAADVEASIRARLGLANDPETQHTGLFGLFNREIGQPEYRMDVEGAVQNAVGVRWCRAVRFWLLPPADDPTQLYVPTYPLNAWRVPCQDTELLQLYPTHLSLIPIES